MADRSALPLLKQCLVRQYRQQDQHGVAASSLQELKSKVCDLLAISKDSEPITLVLAEDGTIVDDEDYFFCLPPNTKFVVLGKDEKWSNSSLDGGTAWLEREVTEVDTAEGGGEKWRQLARQLKDDLSTIILLSEEDLQNVLHTLYQALIDVPCSDLAQELSENQPKTQALQNTLQEVLDRREEERQSRQLLELYLQAVKNEDHIVPKAEEPETAMEGADTVDAGSSSENPEILTSLQNRVLNTLKEKRSPELNLASQELEMVCREDPDALASALSWEKAKTEALQRSCKEELSRRLQQVEALNSLRSISKGKKKLPWEEWLNSKRKK